MTLARGVEIESGVACPPLWETTPYGVVSLLDMIRLYADVFVECFSIIHKLEVQLRTVALVKPNEIAISTHASSVLGNVGAFALICAEHGLSSSSAKCERSIETMTQRNNQVRTTELHQWLIELRERFEDDLKTEVFLHLTVVEGFKYIKPVHGWAAVIVRFPKVRHDIEESSKCFALGRYAASLFHVLLVAEYGVIEVAKLLGQEGDKPGWGAFDRLQKINEKKWQDKTALEQKHSDLLGNVMPLMLSMKNEWRHKISHVDNKLEWIDTDFSPEVASRILSASLGFMDSLAKDLPK